MPDCQKALRIASPRYRYVSRAAHGLEPTAMKFLFLLLALPAFAQSRSVIAVSTMLDGRGGIVQNTRIVVENGKIVRIDPQAAPVTIDLRGRTVMPGFIDTHVHM